MGCLPSLGYDLSGVWLSRGSRRVAFHQCHGILASGTAIGKGMMEGGGSRHQPTTARAFPPLVSFTKALHSVALRRIMVPLMDHPLVAAPPGIFTASGWLDSSSDWIFIARDVTGGPIIQLFRFSIYSRCITLWITYP
uniref:Uncharacterized protein n=1 Tax=Physcomitrium patens TaxID=3218 RepID=A0A2K1KEE1_PHYPA|nr:hypothetical protein PHYPA_008514 [Physcomitrium patens]